MSEFFKQLLSQLTAIWQKLSIQQKIITIALISFTFLGLAGLVMFTQKSTTHSGYRVLYSDLDVQEAGQVTQFLEEGNYNFKLDADGKTIRVKSKDVYEVRMALASQGIPKSTGIGYELFDKSNLGMTDFVQKLNAKRALEGELQRTIEGLEEVASARVHVVLPERTIFLEEREDPKASVVLKLKSGGELNQGQIRGISFLVASSVDGLKKGDISILDSNGKLLSDPYGDDATAIAGSRNLELQKNVELYLERKANALLTGVMGPQKSRVKIAAQLDFDKVEQTLESYNPESRVVRSEERSDENTKNAPDGDHQREKSLTNYEIDKKIEHIVQGVGSVKRLTISAAIDGSYEIKENGDSEYVPRTQQFMMNVEEMLKNTVGYDLARGDQISVVNVRFDNEFLRREQVKMVDEQRWEMGFRIAKYVIVFLLFGFLVWFLRYFANTLAAAMNPPVPKVATLGVAEEIPEEIPEDMRRSSEILERVEILSKEEPANIASIIRNWLMESNKKG